MTIRSMNWILVGGLAFSVFAFAPVVFAHDGEVHEEKTEMSMEQMKHLVTLLNKVVALLTEYRVQYGAYQVDGHAEQHEADDIVASEDEHAHEEEESEHDDHAESTAAALVIEIEPHMGKTHAHIRYTDKAEEMFFIDPAIDDEDGIVAVLSLKTGLSHDVVRAALKYMQ